MSPISKYMDGMLVNYMARGSVATIPTSGCLDEPRDAATAGESGLDDGVDEADQPVEGPIFQA